jgi:outer membrane protein
MKPSDRFIDRTLAEAAEGVTSHFFRSMRMSRKVVMFALTATAYCQDPLLLRDAVSQALARNKTIEAAVATTEATRARIQQARSGSLPKVDFAESWTRSDNPVFVFSSLLTQRQFSASNFGLASLNHPDSLNNFQAIVTADQSLFDAGKTKRAVRTAELSKDMSEEDARRSQMGVIAQVVRQYHDAQLSDERVHLATQAMRSAEADLERAEALRDIGLATDADVLSIRVHIAGIHEEQIRRAADLEIAGAALNDAMGLPLDTEHSLTTALTPLPLSQNELGGLERSALEERSEARQTRLAAEIAAVQAAEARSNYLPKVSLHGAFEADQQRFVARGGSNWLVSIGLRWNLFNGNADKARITESEAAIRFSAAERSRIESGLRLQVRQAWASLRAAQQRIESAEAPVSAARESLRISQNRFAAGLSTVTDLLRTEVALFEAQTRYAAAVHDQRIAAAMLEFAAGTLNAHSEVLN